MLRHVIAPARFFTQLSNEIIRHPRLSSHAIHLLAWQISLPDGANERLGRTAERAGIKKTAFQHAKRELLAEGFLHEWRLPARSGRHQTVQLLSNVPLSAADAAAVRDGHQPAPGRTRVTTEETADETAEATSGDTSPAESPSAASPTAGAPTGRAVGRPPQETPTDNTSHHPTPTTAAAETDPAPAPTPVGGTNQEAEALLLSLAHTDPRLAMPARTARRWAHLATPWLTHATGLSTDQIRHTLTHGLEHARSPLGALRWRLEHALPDTTPPATPVTVPPTPRTSQMRECDDPRHTQPRLFTPRPGTNDLQCAVCREAPAGTKTEADSPPSGSGYRAFRAARAASQAARAAA